MSQCASRPVPCPSNEDSSPKAPYHGSKPLDLAKRGHRGAAPWPGAPSCKPRFPAGGGPIRLGGAALGHHGRCGRLRVCRSRARRALLMDPRRCPCRVGRRGERGRVLEVGVAVTLVRRSRRGGTLLHDHRRQSSCFMGSSSHRDGSCYGRSRSDTRDAGNGFQLSG